MARNFRAAAASGPDWTDVGVYIRDLQNASNGTVTVTLSCPADRYSGPFLVVVRHEYPVLQTGSRPAADEVSGYWPNREARTLEGAVFGQIVQLDNAYSPTGEQLPLNME